MRLHGEVGAARADLLVVLSVPGIRIPIVAAFVGRLSTGMTPLGTVLLVRAHGGSYAAAGVCTAGFALGAAILAPVRGRLIDSRGHFQVILCCGVVYCVGLLGFVVAARAGALLVLIAIGPTMAGLAFPPLSAALLALYASLVEPVELLHVAYAFDASCAEAGFLSGSLLVALLAAAAGPDVAICVAAGLGLTGAAAFVLSRTSRGWQARRWSSATNWALSGRGVRTLLVQATALGLEIGALEICIPAFAERHGALPEAGLLLAVYSVGSLIGGLWLATRTSVARPLLVRRYIQLLAGAALVALPLALAGGIAPMVVLLLANGFFLTPIAACMYLLIEQLAPPETLTEAFTWVTTATFGGAAVGSAAAGDLIARVGAAGALYSVFASGVIAWLTALMFRAALKQTTAQAAQSAAEVPSRR